MLAELVPASEKLHEMKFMTGREMLVMGEPSYVQRSGYTGEDGFEVRVLHCALFSIHLLIVSTDLGSCFSCYRHR